MNEVIKAMQERRSIRKFKPDMVPKDIIDEIVTAGTYAASGMNKQSPIIIAVTNRQLRDKLSKWNADILGSQSDPFYGAPVILILAAHALGVGSCWIHRAKEEFDRPEGKELLGTLGIEGEYEGIGHCALGYADGTYPKAPPCRERRVYHAD